MANGSLRDRLDAIAMGSANPDPEAAGAQELRLHAEQQQHHQQQELTWHERLQYALDIQYWRRSGRG